MLVWRLVSAMDGWLLGLNLIHVLVFFFFWRYARFKSQSICLLTPVITSGIQETLKETEGMIHSTKISWNFGLKLNGSARSKRKSFEKEGPPFEVDGPLYSVGPVWSKLTVPVDLFDQFLIPVPRCSLLSIGLDWSWRTWTGPDEYNYNNSLQMYLIEWKEYLSSYPASITALIFNFKF